EPSSFSDSIHAIGRGIMVWVNKWYPFDGLILLKSTII
ncbi:MAG: hypothetical protein ACI8VY_001547, partial [Cellvibrionaceae bacterium]